MINYDPEYDWDYIYELMLDPRINPFDQIKYSEQIAQLRQEMNDWIDETIKGVPIFHTVNGGK